MAVQVVKTLVSTAGGTGSTPVWGTKIPHASQNSQNNTTLKKKKKGSFCFLKIKNSFSRKSFQAK